MEDIVTKIEQFIEYKQVSKRTFEKEAGITNGIIQRAIRTGSTFGIDNLKKIADANQELNLNWLFKGDGKMIVDNINYEDNINQEAHGDQNQINIQGDNTQTNYVSEPSVEYGTDDTNTNEPKASMLEMLKKELEEKNRLIKEQREEIKEYKETVKKKDERIEVLTDKLISA